MCVCVCVCVCCVQVVEGETFEIREEYDPVEEERRREGETVILCAMCDCDCDCVLCPAKKRERERKMGRVTVPPPRPAFPKKRETPSVGEPLVSETRGEEGVLWAALEKKEAKEEVDHAHKATPTITFRHTAGPELKTPNEVSTIVSAMPIWVCVCVSRILGYSSSHQVTLQGQ